MSIYALAIFWFIATLIILSLIKKLQSQRSFFIGGFILIAVCVLIILGMYESQEAPLDQYQQLATQVILFSSAAVGSNFVAHSFTMKSNA